MTDLNSDNLADDVLGITFSEFGRKAKENGSLGTDHGEVAPMFAFGMCPRSIGQNSMLAGDMASS